MVRHLFKCSFVRCDLGLVIVTYRTCQLPGTYQQATLCSMLSLIYDTFGSGALCLSLCRIATMPVRLCLDCVGIPAGTRRTMIECASQCCEEIRMMCTLARPHHAGVSYFSLENSKFATDSTARQWTLLQHCHNTRVSATGARYSGPL